MKGLIRILFLPLAILCTLHVSLALAGEFEFFQYLLASELVVATGLLFYHRQQNATVFEMGVRKKYVVVVFPLILIALIGFGVGLERSSHMGWDATVRSFVSRENDWIVSASMVGAAIVSLIGLFIDRRNT